MSRSFSGSGIRAAGIADCGDSYRFVILRNGKCLAGRFVIEALDPRPTSIDITPLLPMLRDFL